MKITVSFLPTAEDWADYQEALCLAGAGKLAWVFQNFVIYWVRRWAYRWYGENKDQALAAQLIFTESAVQIKTDRYDAQLPRELLSEVRAEGRVLLLYTGRQETRFVPRRVFTDDEWNEITSAYLKREL